jgi:hypothetical protein
MYLSRRMGGKRVVFLTQFLDIVGYYGAKLQVLGVGWERKGRFLGRDVSQVACGEVVTMGCDEIYGCGEARRGSRRWVGVVSCWWRVDCVGRRRRMGSRRGIAQVGFLDRMKSEGFLWQGFKEPKGQMGSPLAQCTIYCGWGLRGGKAENLNAET